MIHRSLVGLLLALAGCASHEPPHTAEIRSPAVPKMPPGQGRHVRLTLELTPTSLRALDAREVRGAGPKARGKAQGPWEVRVEDLGGRLLFSIRVPAAGRVRGEFPRPDGTLQGVHTVKPEAVLSVRLPVLEAAARVRILGPAWTLDPEDPRAAGKAPEELLELGSAPYPEVAPLPQPGGDEP